MGVDDGCLPVKMARCCGSVANRISSRSPSGGRRCWEHAPEQAGHRACAATRRHSGSAVSDDIHAVDPERLADVDATPAQSSPKASSRPWWRNGVSRHWRAAPTMAAGVIGSMLSALPDLGMGGAAVGDVAKSAEVGDVGAADAVLAVNQALAASPDHSVSITDGRQVGRKAQRW